MDEKARGEAVAESTKRLGEEFSLLRSKNEYPSATSGQSRTPVPTKDTLLFSKNMVQYYQQIIFKNFSCKKLLEDYYRWLDSRRE